MRHKGHEFTPRLTSNMHTILSRSQPEMNGKPHQNPISLLRVVYNAWRLTNAPAAFQWFMNDIFADMIDVTVIIYWMTSSSTLTMYLSTKPMFRKYYKDSMLMEFFHKLISVSFMSSPANTSDICCDPKATPYPHTIIQDWPELWKVKDVQSFLGFANSSDVSFMDTPKLLYHSHVSPKGYHLEL